MSTRRTPAAPGRRPRAGVRFAAGLCAFCGEGFVLDRAEQPWARARTCSPGCAKRLASRGRHSGNCRHCEMVEAWRLAADADLRRIEVAGQDEDARPVSFGTWLAFYEWTSWDEPAA